MSDTPKIEYVTWCSFCQGNGVVPDRPTDSLEGDDSECGECDGLGRILTDQGHDLLDFLNRMGFVRARKQP